MRVAVKVGEEGFNEDWVLVKGGKSGREEGRGEVGGKVFDEMPLRSLDVFKEFGFGDWWWWGCGSSSSVKRGI